MKSFKIKKRDNQKCPNCGKRKNRDQFPNDSSYCFQCESHEETIQNKDFHK